MKRNKKDKGKERHFLDENKNFSCDKAKWLRKKIEREMRHWEKYTTESHLAAKSPDTGSLRDEPQIVLDFKS